MKGLVDDIEGRTEKNRNFRRAPPGHLDKTVQTTKAAAAASSEHFDGRTTE